MKNYYEILEVSKKASKDTINKVFKMHMKANHPDLFQGDEKIKAEEKSKELTEAYNVLSDDNERAKYDAELETEENSNSQLQAIIDENEYLKQLIAQKDEVISRFTGGAQYTGYNGYSNQYGQQSQYGQYGQKAQYAPPQQGQVYYGNGFNGFTPPKQENPYEGLSLEELKQLKKEQTKLYYKEKLKDVGIKLIILIGLIIVLLISLYSSINDLSQMFNPK